MVATLLEGGSVAAERRSASSWTLTLLIIFGIKPCPASLQPEQKILRNGLG